jgi:predicted DNA-binding protein
MSKRLRSIYLDAKQIERLRKLSELTRIPQAVYIREGIESVLKQYERGENNVQNLRT